MKNKKGFTLIEVLVVVLIIGILAAIALPQYQAVVIKARVSSILPIMRRWKDALVEYKLEHGYYCRIIPGEFCDDEHIYASDYTANWPSDWKREIDDGPCGDSLECYNDYWNCFVDYSNGSTICTYKGDTFSINMFQQDASGEDRDCEEPGKIICIPYDEKGEKICKKLGNPSGKIVNEFQCVQIDD